MKQELLINVIFYLANQQQGASLANIHRYLCNDPDYLTRIDRYKNAKEKLVPLRRVIKTLLTSSSEFYSENTGFNETLYFCRKILVNEYSVDMSYDSNRVAENDDDIELSDALINELIDKGYADEAVRARIPFLNEHEEEIMLAVIECMLAYVPINLKTSRNSYFQALPKYFNLSKGCLLIRVINQEEETLINLSTIEKCSRAASRKNGFRR